MSQSSLKDLQKSRSTRSRTLQLTDGLSQEELDYSSGPAVWSIGEVLDHLILTDGVYGKEIKELFELKASGKPPYLRRGFSDIDASILYIPKLLLPLAEIPFNVMNVFLPKAVRSFVIASRLIPAQAPGIAKPRPGRSKQALGDELKAGPDTMEELLASQPGLDPKEFTHYHPLLGENNVDDMLRFLTNHEVVHQKQIAELIARQRRGR